MIIKDKPFYVPACQAMLCWFYASPVVVGLAISSPSGCEVDLVRRWPGFIKLEAYQFRLSRFLVRRWSLRQAEISSLSFGDWDDPRLEGCC